MLQKFYIRVTFHGHDNHPALILKPLLPLVNSWLLTMAPTSSLSMSGFKMKLCLNLIACVIGVTSAQLSTKFYDESCPGALQAIRKAVREAVHNEARMGASLLRLHFHDCFVQASLTFTLSILYIMFAYQNLTFKIMHCCMHEPIITIACECCVFHNPSLAHAD